MEALLTPSQTCEEVAFRPSLGWFVFNEANELCMVIDAFIAGSGEIVETVVPVETLEWQRSL